MFKCFLDTIGKSTLLLEVTVWQWQWQQKLKSTSTSFGVFVVLCCAGHKVLCTAIFPHAKNKIKHYLNNLLSTFLAAEAEAVSAPAIATRTNTTHISTCSTLNSFMQYSVQERGRQRLHFVFGSTTFTFYVCR